MALNVKLWAALALGAALNVSVLTLAPAPALAAPAKASAAPIKAGQKIVMATHSFSVFIGPTRSRDPAVAPTPGPLAALAAERGKVGHEMLAVQMLGGSTPMQHWKQGDGDDAKNIAKAALAKGGVDVFTMSGNQIMPEPGVDLFGDYVLQTNPKARILLQNSWSSWDGTGSTPAVGGKGNDAFKAEDHDRATVADLDKWIAALDAPNGYLIRMRAQLTGINQRAGHDMAYVVPAATAVYTLRKEILAGRVPGVARQSDIFRDGIGHPKPPLANLVTYVWYAMIYRESPVDLQALVDKTDATAPAREKLLQQIAWNAVVAEPMSGVKGKTVRVAAN